MGVDRPSTPDFPSALAHRYAPIGLLGEGGMGSVFLAMDRHLRRKVAVKLLNRAPTKALLDRFRREAKTMAGVRHPNVVEVYEAGMLEGHAYLVLEFLEGSSLEREVAGFDALDLVRPLSSALDCLHGLGLLHRDVKPANVFRTESGRIVLTDFGLVLDPNQDQLTETGSFLGTLGYLAPEVLLGERGDPAQDWWALGVTLYAIGERRLPFTVQALVSAASGVPLPPLEFHGLYPGTPLRSVIEGLLEPRREDRIRSSEDLLMRLDAEEEFLSRQHPRTEESAPVDLPSGGYARASGSSEKPRGLSPRFVLSLAILCLLVSSLVPQFGSPKVRSRVPASEMPFDPRETWEARLQAWKSELLALDRLEIGPDGSKARIRSGLERPGWRPLLMPSPLHQEIIERSLPSLQTLLGWMVSGNVPADLEEDQKWAMRSMDEFMTGQDLDGPFESFLLTTPLPEDCGIHPDFHPLPPPPARSGWLGRALHAYSAARIAMDEREALWSSFGRGEVALDLAESLRSTAALDPASFFRIMNRIQVLPAHHRDLYRWLRPVSLPFEVMSRALLLSLRREPGNRDWVLRNLGFTIGRDSLPVPLTLATRSRESYLRALPRDAAEWYLFGILESRIGAIQNQIVQVGGTLLGARQLSELGLPALQKAWNLSLGTPEEALIQGLVAYSRLDQLEQLGRVEEALEAYWSSRERILAALHRSLHRITFVQVLGLWEKQGSPPSETLAALFEADLVNMDKTQDKKVKMLREQFANDCSRWRSTFQGFQFRSRFE